MDEVLLAGFAISGFRSFHGDVQYVGPLGRVTVLAGHNNDGKSNVLVAAERVLNALRGGGAAPLLGDLNRPINIDPTPNLVAGIAVRHPEGKVEALRRLLPSPDDVTQNSTEARALERLARSQGFSRPDASSYADDALWFRFVEAGADLALHPDQVNELVSQTPGQLGPLHDTQTHIRSNEHGDLERLLNAIRPGLSVPPVILVPAIREIVSGGAPQSSVISEFTGRGLPQLLQRLQSPRATNYRSDTGRYERINKFVGQVLDRRDARILVPYDSETIHVSLGDRVLPLSNLGTGISQVLLLATIATAYDSHLVCMEEPELHLHPTLIRRLIRYLRVETTNQYLITTHSAHLLDDPEVTVFRTSYDADSGTTVVPSITSAQRGELAAHLGYRASDLLQSNSIVWVEGPSDRVYLNHWIQEVDGSLLEGVHYSIMFYGGRLLAHLTGEQMETLESRADEFVNLLRINRNMAIVIDSDRINENDEVNSTKQRIVAEFENNSGYAWITAGREIENYVPGEVLSAATRATHPEKAEHYEAPSGKYSSVFEDLANPDKVGIAERAAASSVHLWEQLDLKVRVQELVDFIRQANQFDAPADGVHEV